MEYTNVERIIAKIDNDFNPNNSDWIPRVGAWVHDALSQLQVNQYETVSKKLRVTDGIARSCNELPNDIKVYDSRGCEVKKHNAKDDCQCSGGCDSSTGGVRKTPQTITAECTGFDKPNDIIGVSTPSMTYPLGSEVIEIPKPCDCKPKTYTRSDAKTIALNYDGEQFITVSYKAPITQYSEHFGCNLPVIPDNGKLIEAIAFYCIYKMLCRGYQHPVFNLGASQYGTNPYYIWTTTKDEAMRSVINEGVDEDLSKLWQSAFFVSTFQRK